MLRKSPSTVKHAKNKSTVGISSKDFFAQEAMVGALLSPTEVYAGRDTPPPVPEITTNQYHALKAGIKSEDNSPETQSPPSTIAQRPMTISAGQHRQHRQHRQQQCSSLTHMLTSAASAATTKDSNAIESEPLIKSKSISAGSSHEYQRRRPAMLRLDGAADGTQQQPYAKLQWTDVPPMPQSALTPRMARDDGNDSDDGSSAQATTEGKRRSPLWRTKLSFTNSRRPDSRRQRHQSFDERSVDITVHPQLYPQSPLVSVPTAPATSHGRSAGHGPPGKSLGSLLAGLDEDTCGDASPGIMQGDMLERDDSVGDLGNLDMDFLLTIQRNTALEARRQRRRDARRNTMSFTGGARAAAARALAEELDLDGIPSSQADMSGGAGFAPAQRNICSDDESVVGDAELATAVHIQQHMPKGIASGHASFETAFDEAHADPSSSTLMADGYRNAHHGTPNSSGITGSACRRNSKMADDARPSTATRRSRAAETHAAHSIETASRPLASRLSSLLAPPGAPASQSSSGSPTCSVLKSPTALGHRMLRAPTTPGPPVPGQGRPHHLSVNPPLRLPHNSETTGPPIFSPTAKYNASCSTSTTPIADRFPDDSIQHSSRPGMQSRSSYTQWAEPHGTHRPHLGIYTDIASPTGSVTSLSSGSTTAVSSSIDAMLSLPATASQRHPPLPGARKFSQQHIYTQALLSPTSSPDILSRSATNLPVRSSADTNVSVGAAPMSVSHSKSMRKMPFGRHNLDSPVGSLSEAQAIQLRPSNADSGHVVATLVDDPLARRRIRDQLASSTAFDKLLEEDEGFTMAISLTPSNVGVNY
ncbi:hypothetical protein DL89DRAFT_263818 [Linderina pennispora]|uniref:Uncharacterized protein n=1 Tax=Linderina pennispora TaxID=61395 RepID=A0A1Y1WL50_9FUNG|nr:uncharacterized protein DL89DRAFT_263818 [Linderina pennispora]ORX73814.1 hypothetical protein DL89DRAFT_263818 [Linderina pennispora]